MAKKQLFKPPPSTRREALLVREPSNVSSCTRFGETVGSTTAECAAVLCCCPCGLVNLLVLAAYKVPAGLCRRALRQRRRQKMMKQGLLLEQRKREVEVEMDFEVEILAGVGKVEKEVVELEMEMWDTFYSTGFWRSLSRRDEPTV